MTKLCATLVCGLNLALPATFGAPVEAQTPPTAYTVTIVNSMSGPSATSKVYRNGSKAVVDHWDSAQVNPAAKHSRSIFDLDKKTEVSWFLPDSSGGCATATISGDWGDPFANSDFTGEGTKMVGQEQVRGFTAKVYQADMGQSGIIKSWIDAKTGLVLKATLTPPGGAAKTIIEVTDVSLSPPPASVFTVLAGCAAK
jgi:hypothetical protein